MKSSEKTAAGLSGWLLTLRRHLAIIITVKVLFVFLLFYYFFAPAHRLDVDADVAASQLGVAAMPASSPNLSPISSSISQSVPEASEPLAADAQRSTEQQTEKEGE